MENMEITVISRKPDIEGMWKHIKLFKCIWKQKQNSYEVFIKYRVEHVEKNVEFDFYWPDCSLECIKQKIKELVRKDEECGMFSCVKGLYC